MAVESFEDVRRLTEAEQRDLLDAGRPEQRLWALWALALRPGQAPDAKLAVLATVVPGAPGWVADLAEQLLDDNDTDVRYETFDALVRIGRTPSALMWLEEAPEGEARLVLLRWTGRGKLRSVASSLASSSRRLRRLLIEVAHLTAWNDIAPAVANEPSLVKVVLGRAPQLEKELPLAIRVRIAVSEPHDTWMHGLAERLEALPSPDPDIAAALPDLLERCTRVLAALEDTSEYDDVVREDLGDWRAFYARILEAASRLLVH